MEYSTLYNLIVSLEQGTNLHIGVLFFCDFKTKKLLLPVKHMIHSSTVCEDFKKEPSNYRRCFKCRNRAIKKALEEKKPFYGMCINGIGEYTHPIVEDERVLGVIFIGNLLPSDHTRISARISDKNLLAHLAPHFSLEDCQRTANLIESYVRMLRAVCIEEKQEFNTLIENVKNYIQNNLEYPIDAQTLSSMFHYHKNYLGRLFKKETGKSISEYINAQRIERVKTLIRNKNGRIIDHAFSVGFENIPYFNRVFKQHTGMTPSAFKKQCAVKK